MIRGGCAFLAILLFWLAYGLSPYVALYRLARAVQAHDAQAVADRVNFRTLRLSLTKQAMAAAVDGIAARRDLSPRERQILNEAAGTLAEPVVETLVTPETLIDLLDDGWPQRLVLDARPLDGPAPRESPASRESPALQESPPAGTREAPHPERVGLPATSLWQLFALFRSAEPRGFRGIVVSYPPNRPHEGQFRLRLRLRGWTWRVVDLELPADLRERISQKLTRAPKR
ncbi:hypothetical protein OPKNFCMD_0876 [Methylobacterium crusticola]|uniref:DUF2939 domain-containing protein n=1 Tax=Methylobacterium crusticola TaxID=1697972 RepID=A0ABQ4QTQ9_9HYPH|nr:DUF2939 domain-containing protein [Methylobacterium crusticola]GJD48160.1 hypothetical protein OPKNFCMD_0876 [Methylobacterium crusticola]